MANDQPPVDHDGKPRASIIIPTYNRADVLPRAVHSALAQTIENIQIIVVDDGSSDHTSEVVKSFRSDPRFQYISPSSNSGGPATPRNLGIQAARADVTVFLDSDDALRPDFVERILHEFDSSPLVGLVWTRRAIYNASTGELRLIAFVDRSRTRLLPEMLTWTPGTCGLAVRRSVFEDIGGFDPLVGALDDLDFTLRFAVSNKWQVRIIDEVLLDYYSSEESVGNSVNARYLTALENFFQKHQQVFQQYRSAKAHYQYRLARVHYAVGNRSEGNKRIVQAIQTTPGNIRYIAYLLIRSLRLGGLWRLLAQLRFALLRWRRRKVHAAVVEQKTGG